MSLHTSKEQYEAACDNFYRVSAKYYARKAELRRQLKELDEEYDQAQEELARHELTPGIPLYLSQGGNENVT